MHIKNLRLKNFRNYADETIEFGEGLNVLYGRNAQGKTNCAEAVYYLCVGISPRTRKDRQLIREGEQAAECGATVVSRCGTVTLSAVIRDGSREMFVNGARIARNADLMGNLCCVFFSPRELRLIQDGPDERRRFLNVSISQLSRSYYVNLSRYNKILEQRNALLKSGDEATVRETLPLWDEQLCECGAAVAEARAGFVSALAPLARDAHLYLTDGAEELSVTSDRDYSGTREEIKERLYRDLRENCERDMRLGYTVSGPHRDDIGIEINGKDAKSFASQGQTRTAALSIELAEVEMYGKANGEPPVLVLDDVMSELDLSRRKKLVDRIDGLQTILTCTHAERLLCGKEAVKIQISKGAVKR